MGRPCQRTWSRWTAFIGEITWSRRISSPQRDSGVDYWGCNDMYWGDTWDNIAAVGILSVTLKIGLFHLLVTDCFMCRVVIVGRYKYKWLRRDSLRVCNEFPLLSYILLTQQQQLNTKELALWVYYCVTYQYCSGISHEPFHRLQTLAAQHNYSQVLIHFVAFLLREKENYWLTLSPDVTRLITEFKEIPLPSQLSPLAMTRRWDSCIRDCMGSSMNMGKARLSCQKDTTFSAA